MGPWVLHDKVVPSGNLTIMKWEIAIIHGKTHYKLPEGINGKTTIFNIINALNMENHYC